MAVPRGTTPTFTLSFSEEDINFTEVANVYVTFCSGAVTLTKSGDDLIIEAQEIGVYLSQKDTLSFKQPNVRIQVNWTYEDGSRGASEIASYMIDEQLLNKVVK